MYLTKVTIICNSDVVSWLVGCFAFNMFQSISGRLPERGSKKKRHDTRE